jgi:hypothetical protein
MAQLTVSLEEGFAQDHVLVRVNGATAFEGTDVTTRMQTGLAAAVQVDAADTCQIEVQLPDRGLSRTVELDGSQTPFVRVSLVDGDVAVSPTDQAPYYA